MSSGLNPDEEREKERQQRDGELLRQISTPNVATIVLLAALEAAPIGGQLFAHDISRRDCTAF